MSYALPPGQNTFQPSWRNIQPQPFQPTPGQSNMPAGMGGLTQVTSGGLQSNAPVNPWQTLGGNWAGNQGGQNPLIMNGMQAQQQQPWGYPAMNRPGMHYGSWGGGGWGQNPWAGFGSNLGFGGMGQYGGLLGGFGSPWGGFNPWRF